MSFSVPAAIPRSHGIASQGGYLLSVLLALPLRQKKVEGRLALAARVPILSISVPEPLVVVREVPVEGPGG